MQHKSILVILLIVILGITGIFFLRSSGNEVSEIKNSNKSIQADKVNHKASFAIYTKGTFRVFTEPMYHNLSDDVFIEAANPNVVIVKKGTTTWRDFFSTLPFKLEENCLTTGTKQVFCTNNENALQFYLNGVKNQKALDETINSGDKLLVTYEIVDSPIIMNQINSIPNID